MGRGFDYVESFDGERDIISCGPGYDEFYTETIDDVKKDCEAYVAPLNYWWATLMGEGP
jgi:hypothetical protein